MSPKIAANVVAKKREIVAKRYLRFEDSR